MQKIILYIELVLFVAATIFSCFWEQDTYSVTAVEKPAVEVKEKKEKPKEKKKQPMPENIYYDDTVKVEYAFVDDGGKGRVKVKNNSENQLISYIISLYCFDKDKEFIDEEEVPVDNVKVASGFSCGLDKDIDLPKKCAYIWARIKSAEFTTAPSWENSGDTYDTSEMYLLDLEDITYNKEDVKKAEQCKFVEITNISPTKEETTSDRKNLIFYIKNIGDKNIKNINFVIAEYNKDKQPVAVKADAFVGANIRRLYWDNAAIATNDGKKAFSGLVLEPDCVSVKLIVESVEFDNGIIWHNEYCLPWILNSLEN